MSDEHVEIGGSITMKSESPTVSTRLIASYLLLYERIFPLERKDKNPSDGSVKYVHTGDLGLRAFGSEPAIFTLSAEVFFNTLGNYTQDSTYLNNLLSDIHLSAHYKEFKR